MNGNKMDFDDLNIDEIINANMTITDHKLRDAIHAVCVDVIYAVAAAEREECKKIVDKKLSEIPLTAGQPQIFAAVWDVGVAIQARKEQK